MHRSNITIRIWLSIGVFVAGCVLTTVLGQVQGRTAESHLRETSESLFPAAQASQEAESAFQRTVKGFGDAVITQDVSGVERAVEDGRVAGGRLRQTASIGGLPQGRAEGAAKLADALERFVNDAKAVYGGVLSNPANLNQETQQEMRELASQTDAIRKGIQELKEQCSRDLKEQLASMRASSIQQRWLALGVFAMTLAVSAVIVNLTIRRSIVGPVRRVVEVVRLAAEQAADTSQKIAHSGALVAQDAHDQAACIEETSASLEEVSTTSRANAGRAREADGMMQAARQTTGRAVETMQNLSQSMEAITKSSNQVAAVLKSIDEIAFNTNILALNAAVEAARAGSAGEGFSVVADEVRSLAHRAADAAKNSAEIVERTIADVTRGVQYVRSAHEAFKEISSVIAGNGKVVSEIAVTSEEQARGVTHIGQAIARIESVTQNNSANARKTADAASAMLGYANATRESLEELSAMVGSK
jgi:hypothetical protein